MGLHRATAELLMNEEKLQRIARVLDLGVSKRYIRELFRVTERQLQHVENWYRGKMNATRHTDHREHTRGKNEII